MIQQKAIKGTLFSILCVGWQTEGLPVQRRAALVTVIVLAGAPELDARFFHGYWSFFHIRIHDGLAVAVDDIQTITNIFSNQS